jgi:putative transposase
LRTGDGARCDPLTVSDAYSRYLLCAQSVAHPDYANCRSELERVFKEYGLPCAIRSDNGTPFASLGVGAVSRLSVWWIKLGIIPERIEPGKPQQNGRHERMHRTLKAECARPPAQSLAAQQRRFDQFRTDQQGDSELFFGPVPLGVIDAVTLKLVKVLPMLPV